MSRPHRDQSRRLSPSSHARSSLPPKVWGQHRFIVVATYPVSYAEVTMITFGKTVNLPLSRSLPVETGCFDCEEKLEDLEQYCPGDMKDPYQVQLAHPAEWQDWSSPAWDTFKAYCASVPYEPVWEEMLLHLNAVQAL